MTVVPRSKLVSRDCTAAAACGLVAIFAAGSLVLGAGPAAGQTGQTLTGTVQIDLPTGRVAADVCVNDLPARGDTIAFVLNRAYSIKRIRGTNELPALMEMEPGGAAIRYTYLRDTGGGRGSSGVAPVCMEYSGSHPIYDIAAGEYRPDDSSSVVAFNGKTIRARGASRWYPVGYDQQTGLVTEAVAFRLQVRCAACEQIYVNGSRPVQGPDGDFVSREPREILLLAGKFPHSAAGSVTFIGEHVAPDSALAFVAKLREIQDYFAEYLEVPFGPPPDIVRIEPLREPRKGQLWGFLSDPALALIGMSIPQFVDILEGPAGTRRRGVFGFLAHELAHRYFGWKIGVASRQRDLFGEPFATFLELKAIDEILGEEEYQAALKSLRERALAGPDLAPLDEAGPDDFAFDNYRYGFAPLQLVALEQTIGVSRMRFILRALITAPPHLRAGADYAFIERAARDAGVTDEEWADWESRCVRRSHAAKKCLRLPGG